MIIEHVHIFVVLQGLCNASWVIGPMSALHQSMPVSMFTQSFGSIDLLQHVETVKAEWLYLVWMCIVWESRWYSFISIVSQFIYKSAHFTIPSLKSVQGLNRLVTSIRTISELQNHDTLDQFMDFVAIRRTRPLEMISTAFKIIAGFLGNVCSKCPLIEIDHHIAGDTFSCILVNEKFCIVMKMSLKLVPMGPINNIPALVQIMAWCRLGAKSLSEPMPTRFIDAYMRH